MGDWNMIRYLNGEEKLKSRELWEEAFPEDSRSFDDYYFAEKLKDNRILVREDEDGQIASMIQLNPYRIQAAGRQWQVDYLVGVATRRTCRHRGYMRSLLLKMMADMREEGMPFCFLMPADEAIYRPFGFTYIFRQPSYQLKTDVKLEQKELIPWQDSAAGSRFLTEVAAWMNQWLEERYEVFAVRDLAYVRRLLKELASEKGSFRLLYDQERMVGMIGDWGLEQRLLYCQEAYVQETQPSKPAIMARIIAPDVFVRAVCLKREYPREEAVVRLHLSDPLIADNDGWWQWHLNRESSWMERTDGAAGADCYELALTVDELTAWLFGYQVPEQAKELEAVVMPLQGIFLDEIV